MAAPSTSIFHPPLSIVCCCQPDVGSAFGAVAVVARGPPEGRRNAYDSMPVMLDGRRLADLTAAGAARGQAHRKLRAGAIGRGRLKPRPEQIEKYLIRPTFYRRTQSREATSEALALKNSCTSNTLGSSIIIISPASSEAMAVVPWWDVTTNRQQAQPQPQPLSCFPHLYHDAEAW